MLEPSYPVDTASAGDERYAKDAGAGAGIDAMCADPGRVWFVRCFPAPRGIGLAYV